MRWPAIALFSDVDGTLLDAHGRLSLSRRDIERNAAHVDLILASSRTLAELVVVQRKLGLTAPLVAENGALVAVPPGWRGATGARVRRVDDRAFEIHVLGATASRIRPIVQRCATRVGVDIVDQRDTDPGPRALARTHSVLVRDAALDTAQRAELGRALESAGLSASRSGRWLAITRGADKGSGVESILALAARRGAPFRVTAAVGNAGNDASLLARVEQRFVVRNPHGGHDPALAALPRVTLLTAPGIAGVPEALELLLPGLRSR